MSVRPRTCFGSNPTYNTASVRSTSEGALTTASPPETIFTSGSKAPASVGAALAVFFFQAEDGIRDTSVTGVQTCALPILDLDPVGHAKLFRQTPTFFTVKSRRVGLVQHQPGAVFCFQLHQVPQRGEIAVHREYGLADNESAGPAMATRARVTPVRPAENFAEVVEIVVGEDPELRSAETRGIDDAGMNQFVDDDRVALVEQSADGPERGS